MRKSMVMLIALGLAPSAFAGMKDKVASKSNAGVYVAATLGASYMSDMQDSSAEKWTSGAVDSATTKTKLAFESGFNYGIAAGYRMDNMAFDVEISAFSNDLSDSVMDDATFRTSPTPKNSDTHDIDAFSASLYMVNAHYTYPLSGFLPRVGFGIGMANVEFDAKNKAYNTTDGTDDNSTLFAYQFIIGVDKAFGPANLGLEYKYAGLGSNDYIFDSTASVHQKFKASAGVGVLGLRVLYNI